MGYKSLKKIAGLSAILGAFLPVMASAAFLPPTPPDAGTGLVAKMLEIGTSMFTLPFTFLGTGNNMYYVGTAITVYVIYRLVRTGVKMITMGRH
jgi:hypothetical protein